MGDILFAGFDRHRHRLALCGDLVNRGPDSAGVLQLARDLDALSVIGNHEVALLEGRRTATLDEVRRQLGSSLDGWLACIESRCTREELTELRTVDGQPWFDFWRGPETVILGHWAQRGKVDLELCEGLDTGCVYGGQLSGLWWPRLEWVSMPARRRYFERAQGGGDPADPTWCVSPR